ncbi:hypothetical protein T4D_366 [Trichinella pseudospiralis]|uniref:Uncharacterized protein n=1 Tax=Trichinella pseudospiralis TaxID=6337 RepID=A0A0V1DPN2_TRIPS|nr:hypothetical protein T4D_366 [Trichinella pseudospiralis]
MLGPGSGTIRRCGPVGQPSDEDVELSSGSLPCLPRYCHDPTLIMD